MKLQSLNSTIYNNSSNLRKNLSFCGTTRIYALTDSHQQTRDKCALLTKIMEDAKKNHNVLALDCGDLFKGIYPRELEVESYLEIKKMLPNLEIVINIGNNDPGYNKESFDYFKKSMKQLTDSGIHVISANISDRNTNEAIDGIKLYAVINRDGDRILVTGFCINNLTQTTYGVRSEDPKKVLENLKQTILDEKPDGLIIMNHDWFTKSEELIDFAKEQGLNVDLLIGGHEHDEFAPNKEQNIYYPHAFNQSMYKFDLVMGKGANRLENIEVYKNQNLNIEPSLEKNVSQAEKETHLLDEVVPSVLKLSKDYSNPCSLGTFLADAMKDAANSEIGMFSTGFLMAPLPYRPGGMITQYDLKRTITAEMPVEKITLTPEILKQVFENALKNRGIKDKGNAKFLQCSQNIKLVGTEDPSTETYQLKQIFINEKPLLDEKTGEVLDPDRQITCTIDPYIGAGGQEYTMLKDLPKEKNVFEGDKLPINKLLEMALKNAAKENPKNNEYPTSEMIDLPD